MNSWGVEMMRIAFVLVAASAITYGLGWVSRRLDARTAALRARRDALRAEVDALRPTITSPPVWLEIDRRVDEILGATDAAGWMLVAVTPSGALYTMHGSTVARTPAARAHLAVAAARTIASQPDESRVLTALAVAELRRGTPERIDTPIAEA